MRDRIAHRTGYPSSDRAPASAPRISSSTGGSMRGTIKFVDPKTRAWGFIIPEDNGLDVHFQVDDFSDTAPIPADAGEEVEFEFIQDAQRRHATTARFISPPPFPARSTSSSGLGGSLKEWAFVPFFPFRGRDGQDYSSVL